MNPTLYDILGVAPDASREEIRKAWREAADRFEPGEGGSTKQFRLFNEAAEVLLDPEQRQEYDARLGARDAEPAASGRGGSLRTEQPADDEPAVDEPADDEPADDDSVLDEATEDEPADDAPDDEPVQGEHGVGAATVPGPPVPGAAAATAGPTALATGIASGDTGVPTTVAPPQDERPSDGAGRNGRRLPWQVLAALGVLTAVAVGVAAYFVVQAQRAEAYQEALDRAPAAAENAADAVLSYNYKSLEADRDAAAKFLTDDYRKQYVDTFDKLVTGNASDTKATVKSQVLASSAMVVGEKRDPHRIAVLLFVNQSTTSAATTGQPSVFLNRVRFDMVEQDGTWLVDGITSY